MNGSSHLFAYVNKNVYCQTRRRAHLLPCLYLLIIPDSRSVGNHAGLGSDEGGLRNEEGSWDTSALGIVLDRKIRRNISSGGTLSSERCQNDAVQQFHFAHTDRAEQSRSSSGSIHVRAGGCEAGLVCKQSPIGLLKDIDTVHYDMCLHEWAVVLVWLLRVTQPT